MFEKFRKNSSIIVKTDGGICSQISFYALGKAFENRGFDVKYDVSWFKDCGQQ